MEKISNLINFEKIKQQRSEEGAWEQKTAKIINLLFRELQDIFPAFKQAWPTQEDFNRAKKSWTKAFIAAGICDIEHLRYGIKKCRLSESAFAPSAGKFIKWCMPDPTEIGLPSVEDAYLEAIENSHPTSTKKWSHHVIRHSRNMTGSFELFALQKSKSFALFKRNYEISIRQFINGQLKEIPKGLEDKNIETREIKKQSEITREEYREVKNKTHALALIKEMLN